MVNFTRLILACLVFAAIGQGCSRPQGNADNAAEEKSEDKEETAFPVEVARVGRGNVHAAYNGTATLEAEDETEIVAKTGGIVLDILVEEGDLVEADQIVARLDREQLQLELERSEATLDRLQKDYTRSSELYQKKLISSDAYELARADLEAHKASHRLTQLTLSYTDVRSPISGVITDRMIKRGNLVNQYETVFKISDFDRLNAVLFVPERELSTLRTDQRALVNVDAFPGRRFEGIVKRISPSIDATVGTFRATVELDNTDLTLKPGMFARVNIVYDRHQDVITVPFDAVILEDEYSYVYRVEDMKAKRVDVTTGYETDGKLEIMAGLEDDQVIVINGQVSLSSGSILDILNKEEAGIVVAEEVQPDVTEEVNSVASDSNPG